jgi:opacity protein-like surface antigen
MRILGGLALAFAAIIGTISQVTAADLPVKAAPAPVVFSAWYLRADIGMSNQQFDRLSYPGFLTAPGFTWLDKGGFDSAPFYLVGVGYQFSQWLRVDVTGEYRGKAGFSALDRYTGAGCPAAFCTNDYSASKSEWVVLANAYIDLGTYWSVTPFVGAGVGVAQIFIEHFRDVNVIADGGGFADTGKSTNFAWALHAGAAYKATPNFAIVVSYRYLNLGDGETGILQNLVPGAGAGIVSPVTFKDIYSHDVMLGVRWSFM